MAWSYDDDGLLAYNSSDGEAGSEEEYDEAGDSSDSEDGEQGDSSSLQHFHPDDVPLWSACGINDVDGVIELLLSNDTNIEHGHNGSTPLMNAAAEGNDEILKMLIAKGGDITFVKKSTGDSSLILAAKMGRTNTVETLLLQPVTAIDMKNTTGHSALWFASVYGYAGIVKMLLERGAMVDITTGDNETPLSAACASINSSPEVVKILLDAGANVLHRISDGISVFYTAMDNNNNTVEKLEIAKLLLHAGADLHAKAVDGSTVLHAVACMGELAMLRFILDKNVHLSDTNNDGHTPIQMAEMCGEQECADMIRAEQLRRTRLETFCMGHQERCGAKSIIKWLDPEMVRMLGSYV
jgi:ankyrin repeat protein